MSASRQNLDPGFPDELVMELLIRLPGKQVARCRCVCKSWRLMIGSAHFKDDYGTRHRGLICYWLEPAIKDYSGLLMNDLGLRWLNFYHSPIRELKEPREEEFSCLYKLGIFSRDDVILTQVVNGLSLLDQEAAGLIIFSVCTGQWMRIHDSEPDPYNSFVYHLGYDPYTKRYKLLKLTIDRGNPHHQPRAQVMTLRPSSSSPIWEELYNDAAGMPRDIIIDWSLGRRASPTDGFLCWFWSTPRDISTGGLLLFDIHWEKFRKIQLPHGFVYDIRSLSRKEVCVRAQFMEHNKHLAVSVWCISQKGVYPGFKCFCYVMDGDEGKRWSTHSIEFPEELIKEDAVLVAANWNSCEMVIMNNRGSDVYCYGRDHTMAGRFQVGKLQDEEANLVRVGMDGGSVHIRHRRRPHDGFYVSNTSYLFDGNNLHLPLRDILRGRI